VRWLVVAAVVVLLLVSCATEADDEPASRPGAVVVASFDFAESQLLAEIYAQALEASGVTVERQLALGPRELVLPAVRAGLVDVVPEYASSALDAIEPGSTVDRADEQAVVTALAAAVAPWETTLLEPSMASNENVVVVTSELAAEQGLRAVSDLAPFAGSLTIGGPPECPQRPRCLPGLAERYGLHFASFMPLATAELVARALTDGVVDVAVLFSTDAALAGGDLVALDDDRGLQPPDPVVPMVRSSILDDHRIAPALDEVSARLTTDSLRFLNWRLAAADTTTAVEARGWLVRQGVVER